jgi:uncharacterized protein YyaL (SSP411 family)
MNPCRWLLLALFISAAPASQPIDWHDWSPTIFDQAKTQHRFVLLDLGTRWCHWCHVMEGTTYADPQVIQLIGDKYLAVRVDADSRPDLANRYEDYGWPATIVFNSDGSEIVKRRGYLTPDQMTSMLKAIIADPTPGPSVTAPEKIQYTASPALGNELRSQLLQTYSETYDSQKGAWGHGQKFLDWNSVEWALRRAAAGDATAEHMARQTLDAQLNLLDPAWGGVYQYSTDDDWQHPHFEKIMQMQTQDMRIYALAYAQFHDEKYRAAAQSIHHYLITFLHSPEGAFYTSQDADLIDGIHGGKYFELSDPDRRAKGIPRIDRHEYTRENGWAIRSLTVLYETTADTTALNEALAAANWALDHRSLGDGGFSHDDHDLSGPYLGDTLAIGQAFLELYAATADRTWLTRSQAAADFIAAHFQQPGTVGIITSESAPGPLSAGPEFDENIELTRWANLLNQYTGNPQDRKLAQAAMRFAATPQVIQDHGILVAGALLADDELSRPALHVVIVGKKSAPSAGELFSAALKIATSYKRLEWYDESEGKLPNSDVDYPTLDKPAAFVCTGTACSLPAFTVDQLNKRITRANSP